MYVVIHGCVEEFKFSIVDLTEMMKTASPRRVIGGKPGYKREKESL